MPKCRPKQAPVHLLVVLGSGGHTAEMFSMLRRMKLDPSVYSYRTYAVSSGDNLSAAKAVEFETSLRDGGQRGVQGTGINRPTVAKKADSQGSYSIVTVPRARRVHQSYLTAPFSTLQCFWACLLMLRGLHPDQGPLPSNILSPYPDLILSNGPATAVCVILAAKALRLCRYLNPLRNNSGKLKTEDPVPLDYQPRTIFVESWARVTTLSLSGKLLLPFVDRFLVQWPALEGKAAWKGMRKTEYVGALVD